MFSSEPWSLGSLFLRSFRCNPIAGYSCIWRSRRTPSDSQYPLIFIIAKPRAALKGPILGLAEVKTVLDLTGDDRHMSRQKLRPLAPSTSLLPLLSNNSESSPPRFKTPSRDTRSLLSIFRSN